nr:hypothetical protein [Tanacetum cinerariifolium]
MLDSYTSNMCLYSWGRSTYASALIEISSLTDLKKSLVIVVPLVNKEGHSFATIDVEYEWTPPRCDTCKIFDHISEKCSKLTKEITMPKANEEGFTDVKSKKGKKQSAKKQVEGIRLSKPNLNLQYRRVNPKSKKSDGNKDGKKQFLSSLEDDDTDWDNDGTKLSIIDESDSEDVDEVMVMEEPNGHKNVSSTRASTLEASFS